MKNTLIICDCETGDLEAEKAPITQFALEIIDPITFDTIDVFDTFIKPYNNLRITPEALKRSRVSMQQINDGMDVNLFMKTLLGLFKKANKSGKDSSNPYFVGHNFGFDYEFISYLFKYLNKNLHDYVNRYFFDTLAMMKMYEAGSLKSSENQKYDLTNCCTRLGITLKGAHGAPADVQATKLLFTKLIKLQRNGNIPDASTENSGPRRDEVRVSARKNFHFEF